MGIKDKRLAAIRNIVENNDIDSQEHLLDLVRKSGFEATQATLSRDLRELRVAKVHDAVHGYCYRLPSHAQMLPADILKSGHFSEGVRSMAFGGQFAVIKTQPGFASAVASLIDHYVKEAILGTIAGDDTVLVLHSDGFSREAVTAAISEVIPGIENKTKIK